MQILKRVFKLDLPGARRGDTANRCPGEPETAAARDEADGKR
jgi:hypothetical protein